MSKLELFKELLEAKDLMEEYQDALHKYNVDIIESPMANFAWKCFDAYLKASFTSEGIDHIYWWLFESVPKIIYMKDPDEELNVEKVEDFWKFLDDNGYIK